MFYKIGIDILSRALGQVPSAQVGLTSLFGMGRGDPHRNRRHKGNNKLKKDTKVVNINFFKESIRDVHNRKLTGN